MFWNDGRFPATTEQGKWYYGKGKPEFSLLDAALPCKIPPTYIETAEFDCLHDEGLLWSSQGIRKMAKNANSITFRNVPSAGARHPLETYLFVNRVEGLQKGIYHYISEEHSLEMVFAGDYDTELLEAVCGQKFAVQAQVLFAWSAVPYRTEWRYGMKAMKYILLDAGHTCENLYLAATAAGLGCCAIGAYDQECIDELLGFPPGPSAATDYECTVYLAAVGKPVH